MTPDELRDQVKREQHEIQDAPHIAYTPPAMDRCHFCGRLAQSLTPVEVIGGQYRMKGECCNVNP